MTDFNKLKNRLKVFYSTLKTKKAFNLLAEFSPYLVTLILAALPVFYTWGKLPIWGDTIIPFNSSGLEKYLYQWSPLQNGAYFSLNYLPYYFFYKLLEFFTDNIYFISGLILFSLKISAGLGIYKLSKFLYPANRQILYLFPIIFYLLSPAQLSGSYYSYIYSVTPWFIYFIFKIIKTKTISTGDILWLSILLFFGSINLPNPKYIFHLFFIASIILIINLLLKTINFKFFSDHVGKFCLFLLLTAYLVIPQLNFVLNYQPAKYDVHIKANYKDSGQMMDHGQSTIDRMFRLHKDSINQNSDQKDQYNTSLLINFISYLFVILIILNFTFTKKPGSDQTVLMVLLLSYLVFAVGPNPPFGYLYQRIIELFPLLAFLRTTAGATFFLSTFYALLIFPVILHLKNTTKQNLTLGLLILSCLIVGFPILSGEHYKNVKIVSPATDVTQRGIKIPADYAEIQKKLQEIKIDTKTLYPFESYSYLTTDWGYFGVPIYDFLYSTNNVDSVNVTNWALANIGYVLNDKSSYYPRIFSCSHTKKDLIEQTKFIELSKIPTSSYLPHFYVPQNIVYSKSNLQNSIKALGTNQDPIRSAYFSPSSNQEAEFRLSQTPPRITFIRINPTKYRVKVENATGPYFLVFSESFHQQWKLYLNTSPITNYDQLYGQTIATYFDGDIQEGTHKNSFINKSILETIGWPPFPEEKHSLVNNYANAWEITPEDTYQKKNYELIVEFQPQKMAYISLIISFLTFILCLLAIAFTALKKRLN